MDLIGGSRHSQLGVAGSRGLERWEVAELLGVNLEEATANAVDVRVARLRQKLRQVGVEGPAIRSIRKYGYELIMPAVLTE